MAPRYGSYSKAFSDNWKYLSEGDWRRETKRFQDKYEEELKDWERYQGKLNKIARKKQGYQLVKDIAVAAASGGQSLGMGGEGGGGDGGGEGFGKAMESMDKSGLLDFGVEKFLSEKYRPKEMLKEFEFANMDVKGFARLRKQAKSVQKEFDQMKKEALGKPGPRVLDHFSLEGAVSPWADGDTKKTPTGSSKYESTYSPQTSQAFSNIMKSAGIDTSGIDKYQDLRSNQMDQYLSALGPITTVD